MWCRDLSAAKAKKLSRSLSCKLQEHTPFNSLAHAITVTPNGSSWLLQLKHY